MAAYSTLDFIGEMAKPILPMLDFGSPLSILVQFSPPSVLLCKEVPGPPPI